MLLQSGFLTSSFFPPVCDMFPSIHTHWQVSERRASFPRLVPALPCRQVLFFVGILLCLGGGSATSVHAQVFRSYAPEMSGLFMQPPRSVRQQLDEAERAIAEQRYSEAILSLGKMLQRSVDRDERDDLSGQDFFLDIDPEATDTVVKDSMLRKAEELLGGLPESALEIYELNYGAVAQRELDAATAGRDWRALREIVRRYYHTPAGYQAAYLLGQHYLRSGSPRAASVLLQRLAAQRRAATLLGSQLDLALAVALDQSNREAALVNDALRGRRTGDGGTADDPSAQVRYQTAAGTLPAITDGEEIAWLRQHFPLQTTSLPSALEQYPIAGGDASRSLSIGGSSPISSERWKVETHGGAIELRALQEFSESLANRGNLTPASWLPLLVDNQVLMRTTQRLMGVDFRTGKRVWEYPWESATADPDPVALEADRDGTDFGLKQRVWFDLPYGRLSSDGERVFLLDDLSEMEPNRRFGAFGFQPVQRGVAERKNVGANTLVALDLKSEGRLLWRLGVGEEIPSPLGDAFFLGPPLPVDGLLYVIAEVAGDLRLLCLQPLTGAVLWTQQLLTIEMGDIETDIARRISGAMPAYSDGVLICPTGAGAVTAVDLTTRSLLWGVRYRRSSELINMAIGRGSVDPQRLLQRWHDGTPQIIDGKLFITPIESDRLLALDLLTGQRVFQDIPRGDYRYLAGVHDGRLLLVGSREVHAYDSDTGERLWEAVVPETGHNAQVAGTGLFGEGVYFVPLTNRQLVSVQLSDGQIASRQQLGFELGNLVQGDGEIISQGPTELAVSQRQDVLESQVEFRLAANADDLWALLRKSQLLIEAGQRQQALQTLAKARQVDPDDEDVRQLSVTAMLSALQDDFDAHTELLEPLQSLVRFPERKAELLALMTRSSLQGERPVEAVKQVVELSKLLVRNKEIEDRIRSNRSPDGQQRPSLDSWIAGQVLSAIRLATPSQADEINAVVTAYMNENRNGSSSLKLRMVRHFTASPGADELQLELLDELTAEASLAVAERTAMAAIQQRDDPRAALPYHIALYRIYEAGGFNVDARVQRARLQKLAESLPDDSFSEQLAGLDPGPDVEPEPEWPAYVRTKWVLPQSARGARFTLPDLLDVQARSGQHVQAFQIITEDGKSLAIRNPEGRVTASISGEPSEGGDGIRAAMIDGGTLVALMPRELIAVDLFAAVSGRSDALLWRHPWRDELGGRQARSVSSATPFGDYNKRYEISEPRRGDRPDEPRQTSPGEYRLGPIHGNQVFVLNAGQLQAFDLARRGLQWSTGGVAQAGWVLAADDQVAVVSRTGNQGMVERFRTIDGKRLDQHTWPLDERLWFATGRHLLTYKTVSTNLPESVTLTDVFSNEVVLQQTFDRSDSAGTIVKGRISDGRWLTLLQADGHLDVWDLVQGRQVCEQQIGAIEKLSGVHVLVRDQHIIIAPETNEKPKREPNTLDPEVAQGNMVSRVDGPLLCIDQQSGQTVWTLDLPDGPWGCTLSQALGSPLIVLNRAQAVYSPTNTSTRQKLLSVLAIDAATGEIKSERRGLKLPSFSTDIAIRLSVDSDQKIVSAGVGAATLQFEFTDEQPQPEADVDGEAETDASGRPREVDPFDLFR